MSLTFKFMPQDKHNVVPLATFKHRNINKDSEQVTLSVCDRLNLWIYPEAMQKSTLQEMAINKSRVNHITAVICYWYKSRRRAKGCALSWIQAAKEALNFSSQALLVSINSSLISLRDLCAGQWSDSLSLLQGLEQRDGQDTFMWWDPPIFIELLVN